MTIELRNKIWRVTAWRESIPKYSADGALVRTANAVANTVSSAVAAITRTSVPVETSASNGYSTRLTPDTEQLEITGHRVKFKVERNFSKHPSSCDIYISNLSDDTRSELETKPLKVQIEAGYNDESRLLFVGDVRFSMSEIEGATWTTLLQLGDASRAYSHARVNRSYKAGTTYRTILQNAVKSMGLVLPSHLAADPRLDTVVITGTVSFGPANEELTRILAPFGYHWSIQNDELRVLRDEDVVSDGAIPVDEEHGMIGTPTFGSPPKSGKPPHMHVKMLLYPELRPGDLVSLTSKVKNGFFRIERVRHQGDSHAKENWVTDIEIKPYRAV